MSAREGAAAPNSDTTAVGWWIDFWSVVPGTPLAAPYSWGPYSTEIQARVDARLVSAERVEVVERETDADDWKFPAYPPGSALNG